MKNANGPNLNGSNRGSPGAYTMNRSKSKEAGLAISGANKGHWV
jgi:hypothetical protein